MKFQKRDLFYILIILILLLFGLFTANRLNNVGQKYENLENTISAMNDTVNVINNKDGSTTYQQQSPEIYLKEFLKSEYFQTLSQEQQDYYNELNDIKRLISATKAELQKQGEVLAEINAEANPGDIDLASDSISFKLGEELTFAETDTTKHLQWNATVGLNETIDFKLKYDYQFDVMTTFERQKDKSILVKYNIDDPELSVNQMQNFIIPPEQKNSAFGRWYTKNKRVINIVGGVVLFGTGGYVGYSLAK